MADNSARLLLHTETKYADIGVQAYSVYKWRISSAKRRAEARNLIEPRIPKRIQVHHYI